MNKLSGFFVFAMLALAVGNVLHAQDAASIHSWIASDGRVIQAKFVKLDGESVVIEKDGKQFPVPFAKLSAKSVEQARMMAIPAADAPVPVTLRAISIPPENIAAILPDWLTTDTLDAAAMQRMENAIQQKRAEEVGKWQRQCASGKKEEFKQTKEFIDDNHSYNIGSSGSLTVTKGVGSWDLCHVELFRYDNGSLEGPTPPKGSYKFARRTKHLSGAFSIRKGSNALLAVLPASPTDGNNNLLLIILSLGDTAPTDVADDGQAPRSSILAEIFTLPPGTAAAPDVATLQRMRLTPKARVSIMAVRTITSGVRCRAESYTETTYFTAPEHTECRNVGFSLELESKADESPMVLSYSTLLAPYTSADYRRVSKFTPSPRAKPEDFEKMAFPHILGARARSTITNPGSPSVVRMDTEQNNPIDKPVPVYFALVTCLTTETSPPK